MTSLLFSYDVGYASIGWSVLEDSLLNPQLLGCGAVIFPADDCLASQRRLNRRMRRNIRSTRLRIARLKLLLQTIGVLSEEQLDAQGGPWPWKLAARVLDGGKPLTWPELWDVLRWYAHNRGYDGNRRWSNQEDVYEEEGENSDDTKKVTAAKALMEKLSQSTMCGAICAQLKVNPHSSDNKTSSRAYKTLNLAFPRRTVEREVEALLEVHVGKLPGVTHDFILALCAADNRKNGDDSSVRSVLARLGFTYRLPARYVGGLLFGQAVPRFDNRIIGLCRFTGEKRPLKQCYEFMRYRWAMLLANVRIRENGSGEPLPLTIEQKNCLNIIGEREGRFTKTSFKAAVKEVVGHLEGNLESMLSMPEADEALVLDPALALAQSNDKIKNLWVRLPERLQKIILGRWRKGRLVHLRGILAHPDVTDEVRQLALAAFKANKKLKLKWEQYESAPLEPRWPTGRAPYSRNKLIEVHRHVFSSNLHPAEEGGPLHFSKAEYELKQEGLFQASLSKATCPVEMERLISQHYDGATNNHLVRHRLKMLERLTSDMVKTYAGGDSSRVSRCSIEVASNIMEFSGKTQKEIEMEMGQKVKNFKDVSEKLLTDLTATGASITAGLIRKARIADDLGWKCPYTGVNFDAADLVHKKVDKDHIIPRSFRPSDSMDSLVITFDAVNRMKGQRTALQFITEDQGKVVSGTNYQIQTLREYQNFLKSLAPDTKPSRFSVKGSYDDALRKWNRRQKLELLNYNEPDFTPRDLTVTSHLSRMAAQRLYRIFPQLAATASVTSLPGSLTGEVRKSWNLIGCLAEAAPEILEQRKDSEGNLKAMPKPKGEIRNITHLHHALDAAVIGYSALLLPKDGELWQQIISRKVTREQLPSFRHLFGSNRILHLRPKDPQKPDAGALKLELNDLPNEWKQQLSQRLLERRVVQHVPADMSGALLEQTDWRVLKVENGVATLSQRNFGPKDIQPDNAGGDSPTAGARRRVRKDAAKPITAKVSSLVGLRPGKLHDRQAVRIISGNYGVAILQHLPSVTEAEPLQIIPFHQVRRRITELTALNSGKTPMILRNGLLIEVKEAGARSDYRGIWRIRSCKNNAKMGIVLDISRPDLVPVIGSKETGYENVRLSTISACNLCRAGQSLVGPTKSA